MRNKFAVLLFVFVCAIAAAAPASAQDAPVASINSAYLNVRSGPGLGFGTIATLPRGFGVNLVGRNQEGNWVLITLTNGTQGWVNINYIYTTTNTNSLPLADNIPGTPIEPSASITGFVVAELRTGPNEGNPVITNVPLGTGVALLGRNFDSTWVLIRIPSGSTGWVQARAVTSTVPVRALSPADGSVYAPPAPAQPTTPGTPGTGTYQRYVIRQGDTLFAIATQYSVNVYELAALNGIYNVNLIYYGQTLLIPN